MQIANEKLLEENSPTKTEKAIGKERWKDYDSEDINLLFGVIYRIFFKRNFVPPSMRIKLSS